MMQNQERIKAKKNSHPPDTLKLTLGPFMVHQLSRLSKPSKPNATDANLIATSSIVAFTVSVV